MYSCLHPPETLSSIVMEALQQDQMHWLHTCLFPNESPWVLLKFEWNATSGSSASPKYVALSINDPPGGVAVLSVTSGKIMMNASFTGSVSTQYPMYFPMVIPLICGEFVVAVETQWYCPYEDAFIVTILRSVNFGTSKGCAHSLVQI